MSAGKRKKSRFRVAIVGGGRVGQVLGRLLSTGGQKIECVISRRSSSARAAGRFIGCRSVSTSLSDIPRGVNLVLIATPHDAIIPVAETLSRVDHLHAGPPAVCHTSGMLTATALDALAGKGFLTFSFHPLQTFPRDFHPRDIVESIRGIAYGVDGPPKGIRVASSLAGILKGSIVIVPPEMREFYHAACVVASNHVTALLHVLETMYEEMGTTKKNFLKIFRPIIEATLNNVELTTPAKALSGPVARGGVETVAGHLASIRKYRPELMAYFIRMTDETVRLALEKGSLTEEKATAMRNLMRSYGPQFQELT